VIVSGEGPVQGVDLALPPASIITGRLVDEYGEPVQYARVGTAHVGWVAGQQRVVSGLGFSPRFMETDDRGEYRLFNVPPGRYLVMAVVNDRDGSVGVDLPGYVRTFFPGTSVPTDSLPVDVEPGQDRLNVDFALARVRTARIAGIALNPDGTPLEGSVSLNVSYRSGAVATGLVTVRTSADGRFEFGAVMPGEYVLQASRANLSATIEGPFGSRFVTVTDADLTEIVIRATTGSIIEGRVRFDGTGDPEPGGTELSPAPADGDSTRIAQEPSVRAEIRDDWTFTMAGIHGAQRLRLLQAPAGWTLKAIFSAGRDITDMPLSFGTPEQSLRDIEVWLSDRISGITGGVTDDRGQTVRNYTVVAFGVDRRQRYPHSRFIVHGEPGSDGTFALADVAPGEYYVAAINRRQLVDLSQAIEDPAFLTSLTQGAVTVRLAEGEAQTIRLRLNDK
jgi:hypothetical protein